MIEIVLLRRKKKIFQPKNTATSDHRSLTSNDQSLILGSIGLFYLALIMMIYCFLVYLY